LGHDPPGWIADRVASACAAVHGEVHPMFDLLRTEPEQRGESSMGNTNGRIHIEGEQADRAVEVASGFWVIGTKHRPGYSRFNPEVNNRCLIFKLRDASAGNQEVLVVVNAVDGAAIDEVRRIEAETRVPIRYLVAPGGGHSVMLPEWHDRLPGARVLVGPARIPRIAAGKKLASSPRFATLDGADPLPQFKGQLEAVNFDGLLGFRENVTPKEGGKDSALGMLKVMLTEMPPKDPIDELWLYHVASRTVIGGENLGWILTKSARAAMPFMMRMMMKAEQLYLMKGPRGVADAQKVAANWKKVLAWPAETAMTYHDTIGTAFGPGAQAALTEAVRAAKQA
jgi:hypothetical protein